MDTRLNANYSSSPQGEQSNGREEIFQSYSNKEGSLSKGEPATPRMLRTGNKLSGSEVYEQSNFTGHKEIHNRGNNEQSLAYNSPISDKAGILSPVARMRSTKGSNNRVTSGGSNKYMEYSLPPATNHAHEGNPRDASMHFKESELLPAASVSPATKRIVSQTGTGSASPSSRSRTENEHIDSMKLQSPRNHPESDHHHHHHQGKHQSQRHHQNQQQTQQQQFHRKSIGDWNFVKTVGAGSMGKVKLAQNVSTGELCAVKIVPRAAKLYQRAHANDPQPATPQIAAQKQKEFEKEIARDKRTIREGSLGRLLFHPFICRLYEIVPMTNHYYMLFEYIEGGQMLDYIVSHGSLKEANARKFSRGIASALDYCHKNNVVHRDLKIENIMINSKGDIKIIDFGLSNLYSPKSLLKTYCGSLYFAAPELLSAKPYMGPEVDVWSFGVVLYVLVCGKVPFDDQSVSVLHEKIKRGNVEYPNFLSKECISLLSRMLVVDPTRRASLYEVINHPWMNKGYDAPISSYVPKRIPLQLPLDPEIIRTIASFDIGTEQTVAEELTSILSSMEYQICCENWYKITKSGREYASASNAHMLPDPTGGYHPLISIYYLVAEMKRRKKVKEDHTKAQATNIEGKTTKSNEIKQQTKEEGTSHTKNDQNPTSTPKIPFPEQAHTSSPTRFHEDNRSDELQKSEEHIIPAQQPQSPRQSFAVPDNSEQKNKAGGFNSLLRRLSSKKQKNVPIKPVDSQSSVGSHQVVLVNPPQLPIVTVNDLEREQVKTLDPMVRRGMSMKVTAKEKSFSPSTTNLADENKLNPHHRRDAIAKDNTKANHARSSSTSTTSYEYRIPSNQQLPPLPKIDLTNAQALNLQPKEKPNEKLLHPTARAKSVGSSTQREILNSKARQRQSQRNPDHTLPNALASQNSDEERLYDAEKLGDFFDDVSLDGVELPVVPQLTESQIIDQFNNSKPNSMPSIEYPKTLFLKGFFSVQTTSTKPLPLIRYNIINVLSKLGVKFQEVKGGFICAHTSSFKHSHGEEEHNINAILHSEKTKQDSEERRLVGDAFSSDSFETSNTVSTPKKSKTSDQELSDSMNNSLNSTLNSNLTSPTPNSNVKTHRSSNSMTSSHRRKFSIGNSLLASYRKKNASQVMMPPNTPASARIAKSISSDDGEETTKDDSLRHTSDDSVDSFNGITIGGGSDMLMSSSLDHKAKGTDSDPHEKTKRSPLRFEIHIVKVPLVGLYGVQFKKLQGNTWNYKTLASQILGELNL